MVPAPSVFTAEGGGTWPNSPDSGGRKGNSDANKMQRESRGFGKPREVTGEVTFECSFGRSGIFGGGGWRGGRVGGCCAEKGISGRRMR